MDDPVAAEEAATAYRRFVVDFIVTGDDGLRADSHRPAASDRLYDLPWVVLLLAAHDTRPRAAPVSRLLRPAVARTSSRSGSASRRSCSSALLRAVGRDGDAGTCRASSARTPRAASRHARSCPRTRSTTSSRWWAPLLEVLCVAARLTDDPAEARTLDGAIAERLPWLLAFGGPQPHVRMRDIAIRHWDGYWFGREQLWGDVFPHHWSVLTANVLLLLPAGRRGRRRARPRRAAAGRLAAQIYAANLVDFPPDGTATAAFVMPSCVSGRPAHRADPVANDQDWALFWPLHLASCADQLTAGPRR